MKEKIHPKMNEITITCACGNAIRTASTAEKSYAVEICSACHPFFTGKQKLIDSAGKIEKFKKKYAHLKKEKKEDKKENKEQ